MPAAPEIREAIRAGSWIRKMFEDGAVLKAERGEENVFDFTLGNPYGDPPAALSAELARLCAETTLRLPTLAEIREDRFEWSSVLCRACRDIRSEEAFCKLHKVDAGLEGCDICNKS